MNVRLNAHVRFKEGFKQNKFSIYCKIGFHIGVHNCMLNYHHVHIVLRGRFLIWTTERPCHGSTTTPELKVIKQTLYCPLGDRLLLNFPDEEGKCKITKLN